MEYHRRTIRLNGFDYSNDGYYFVTFCTYDRKEIFGQIRNNEIFLNNNRLILKNWLFNLINRFGIEIIEYQIMPNHCHIIIRIVGANHDSPKIINNQNDKITNGMVIDGQWAIRESPLHKRSLLSKIIGYLKMNVSKEIGMQIWQRNYYEHIIRNEKELEKIKKYIKTNPMRWENKGRLD